MTQAQKIEGLEKRVAELENAQLPVKVIATHLTETKINLARWWRKGYAEQPQSVTVYNCGLCGTQVHPGYYRCQTCWRILDWLKGEADK